MKNNNPSSNEVEYASFSARMMASVIDTILSSVILIPLFNIFSMFFDISSPTPITRQYISPEEAMAVLKGGLPSMLFQTFVMAAAVIAFWIYKSATPGKMLLKMKIVDANTGACPTKMQCVVRYLGYFVSFFTLCIGFVWIYYDKRGQGFHDKIAGTVVVKY